MCFCETNRICFTRKTACIHLRSNGLYGWTLGFPIRFVWRGNEVASPAHKQRRRERLGHGYTVEDNLFGVRL